MREHLSSHLSYMAASMILIMIPYVENVLTLGNMVGKEVLWLGVSLGKEPSILFALHASMGA